MKVQVIKSFGSYKRGPRVFDWPGGAARLLVASGFLREVKEDEEPETATDKRPVERAQIPRKRKP